MSSDATYGPFTRIRGNTKYEFDEELGPVTIWLGDNKRGKSARITTANLSLLGEKGHPGAVHPGDFMRLAPERAAGLLAELDGPDGAASFRVDVVSGKPKKPVHKLPPKLEALSDEDRQRILPMVSMGDLLELGPDRGRRALITRFGDVRDLPEPLALDDDQKALWARGVEAVKAANNGADAAELLAALNKWFSQRKLADGKQIKLLEGQLESREQRLATSAAGSEQLPALRAQLKQAKAWEDAAHLRIRLEELAAEKVQYREKAKPYALADQPEQRKAREEAEAAKRAELEQAVASVKAAVAEADAAVKDQERRHEFGTKLVEVLQRLVAAHKETGELVPCPVCLQLMDPTGPLADISPQVEARGEQVVAALGERTQHAAKIADAERALGVWQNQLAAEKAKDQAERASLRAWSERVLAAEREVKAALEKSEAPDSYAGPTSAELAQTIEDLEEADRSRAQLEEETARLRSLRRSRDLAKALEGESKKLLAELTKKVQTTAEDAVNRGMPEGERAVLDLDKSVWNVVGRDARAHGKGEMCGFEFCSLIPALAMAYTEGAPARFLALDDGDLRGFSKANLQALLRLLVQLVAEGRLTQVFLAHSWLTPDEVPEGVTAHWLGDHLASTALAAGPGDGGNGPVIDVTPEEPAAAEPPAKAKEPSPATPPRDPNTSILEL